MKTDKRFLTWLRKQDDRDDPIGDLARDVKIDLPLRYKRGSVDYLESHMRMVEASDDAMTALSRAAHEYAEFRRVDENV